MNKVIIFQLVLFMVLIVGSILGFIGWNRVGQVFLAAGIIDLILSIAAWRGWPILRGDIANDAPLSKRDSSEAASDEYALAHVRPSIRFVVKIAGIGILIIGIGVILIVFST
jgi:hypothetical protein